MSAFLAVLGDIAGFEANRAVIASMTNDRIRS
jgi:hypothetical protein